MTGSFDNLEQRNLPARAAHPPARVEQNTNVVVVPLDATATQHRRRRLVMVIGGALVVIALLAIGLQELNGGSKKPNALDATATQEQVAMRFLLGEFNADFGTAWDLLSTKARQGESRERYIRGGVEADSGDPEVRQPRITNVTPVRVVKLADGRVNVYLHDEFDNGDKPDDPVVRLIVEAGQWRVDDYTVDVSEPFLYEGKS